MTIDRIFFDVDGVIANFNHGAMTLHGLHDQTNPWPWPKGIWAWHESTGLSAEQFFANMEVEFWTSLPRIEDGFEMLALCEAKVGADNVCLLTSDTDNDGCYPGKVAWVKQHLPTYRDRMFTGRPKFFCAHRTALLVDDADKNIRRFTSEPWGGHGLLVPRVWNSLYHIAEVGGSLDYVRRELERY